MQLFLKSLVARRLYASSRRVGHGHHVLFSLLAQNIHSIETIQCNHLLIHLIHKSWAQVIHPDDWMTLVK